MRTITLYLLTLIAGLNVTSACQRPSNLPAEPKSLAAIPSQDVPAPVIFKIREVGRRKVKGGDEVTWLATHDSASGAAKFKIRMVLKKPEGYPPMAFTEGTLLREADSDPGEFLRQVAKALEAKGTGAGRPKVSALDFTAALLGQDLSRGPGSDVLAGGFTSEPPGGWIATKVFVADGEGEFFLNLNPKEGVGEISIKDSDYGDVVLGELGRVF
jgi:hypothetical protein